MKRYTIILQTRSDGLDAGNVRAAMERRLLRSPVTFRLGQPAADPRGTLRVPIGSDSSREDVLRYLRGIESDLPLALAGIEWGWPVTADGLRAASPASWEIDDPYAGATAEDPERREFGFGIRQAFSLAFSLGLPVAWCAYAVARLAWHFEFVPLEMALLLLFWIGTAITLTWPTRMVARIAVAPDALGLRYRFPPRGLSVRWPDIQGLDVGAGDLRLHTPGRTLRFSIRGLRDPGGLIGAIVQRSSLRFVEGRVGPALLYRQAEAP
ncbi:MAG: hypothetical protein A2Y93_06885 [Chloroflexi bacterium RBG_13_68_17]|nr:MAG: hypothetical protein A2Y93_06885 [Chloroflexi bacterium RBG_13_68_17]